MKTTTTLATPSFSMPHWKDARWLLFGFQILYVIYELLWPGFNRNLEQLAAAFVGCFLLDVFLLRYYVNLKIFPLSGLNSTMSTFLLIDAPNAWTYALVGAAAILSKHFIVSNKRHIFNPTAFALVFVTVVLGREVTTAPGRWGNEWPLIVMMVGGGLVVAYLAQRWVLAVTFILTFVAATFVRSLILPTDFTTLLIPVSGVAFHLFSFYFMTDPVTTPQSKWSQVLFAVTVGFGDMIFRLMDERNAPFLALFIVTALYAGFRRVEPRKQVAPRWIEKKAS